ncbi:DNA polymerase delta, subunit 4 domain containing protein [Elaphomyces granulatus]
MPPSRHRSGNRAVKQATLSFGQKSRVSKASTTASTKKEKDVERIANSVSAEDSLDEQPTVTPLLKSDLPTTEVVIRTQAKAEIEQPRAEEDVRASKVTEADLKRYWKNEERKRRARGRFIIRLFPLFLKNNYRWTPAYVHYLLIRVIVREDGLDTYEKILRHFDLSSQYGPCVGISRLSRWRRAQMLSLDPPIEVLAVLLKEDGDVNPRAYIDELMSY